MSYNTFELTRQAVASVLDAANGLSHEVIVVDNDSPDGSAQRLQEVFDGEKRVEIIANDANLGFATANNIGARRARGEVLYFLNSDTVSQAGSAKALVDFVWSHNDAGAVGPRVLNPDGSDQVSTSRFTSPLRLLRHYLPVTTLILGRDRRQDFIPAETSKVDVVKGCALAVARERFDKVGGWDESYFMYSEETELCKSLADAGYSNYYCRDAVITHFGGASTKLEDYASQQLIQAESAARFISRHYGRATVVVNRVAGFLGFAGRSVIFRILARFKPQSRDEYRKRAESASALWRWFLRDYRS